jgi:hypothetical protein
LTLCHLLTDLITKKPKPPTTKNVLKLLVLPRKSFVKFNSNSLIHLLLCWLYSRKFWSILKFKKVYSPTQKYYYRNVCGELTTILSLSLSFTTPTTTTYSYENENEIQYTKKNKICDAPPWLSLFCFCIHCVSFPFGGSDFPVTLEFSFLSLEQKKK